MMEWFKRVWSGLVWRRLRPVASPDRTVDPPFVEAPECGFPIELQKAIFETSRALALGLPVTADIAALRRNLARVGPETVHTAARDISSISGFWRHRLSDRWHSP